MKRRANRLGMTIYIAETHADGHDFAAAGLSREAAEIALTEGLQMHATCKNDQTLDVNRWVDLVKRAGFNLRIMDTGVCHRGSFPMWPTI